MNWTALVAITGHSAVLAEDGRVFLDMPLEKNAQRLCRNKDCNDEKNSFQAFTRVTGKGLLRVWPAEHKKEKQIENIKNPVLFHIFLDVILTRFSTPIHHLQ